MNNNETNEAIQFLNDTWTQKPMSESTARIWGAKLSQYTHEDVMLVLSSLAYTEAWRPSLAAILKPLEGSAGGETAEEGYASVCRAFRRGEGSLANYLTERTRRTVAHMGGWGAIGQRTDWDTFGRKAFLSAYESAEAVSVDRQRSALSSGPVRALGGK